MKVKRYLNSALKDSNLLESFVDKADEQLEKLDKDENVALLKAVKGRKPKDVLEAGALAMLRHMLEDKS